MNITIRAPATERTQTTTARARAAKPMSQITVVAHAAAVSAQGPVVPNRIVPRTMATSQVRAAPMANQVEAAAHLAINTAQRGTGWTRSSRRVRPWYSPAKDSATRPTSNSRMSSRFRIHRDHSSESGPDDG